MTLWLGNGNHPDIREHQRTFHGDGYPSSFPLESAWERSPANVEFLVAVAWDFGPGSERRDGYFIQRRRSKAWPWALWAYVFDDNWETWRWVLRATSNSAYADAATAGRALLQASWEWERGQWQTGQFDEVEFAGVLSEPDAWEVGAAKLGDS
jgi:hypothetical protein